MATVQLLVCNCEMAALFDDGTWKRYEAIFPIGGELVTLEVALGTGLSDLVEEHGDRLVRDHLRLDPHHVTSALLSYSAKPTEVFEGAVFASHVKEIPHES